MKKVTVLCFILTACVLIACNANKRNTVFAIQLKTTEAKDYNLTRIKGRPATVITFFSPECPLSENYTSVMLTLQDLIAMKDVLFITVIPGDRYSEDTIRKFAETYKLKQPILLDSEKKLTNFLHATITPETFVLNNKGAVVYRGAIDNWAVDLGTKRQLTTEHYLMDAIQGVLKGTDIDPQETTAVGCYIE